MRDVGTLSRRRSLVFGGIATLGILAACSVPPAGAPKRAAFKPTETPKPVVGIGAVVEAGS
ncbi:MAG: hypothetical protein M3O34_01995 [Chloroflexota bacterium]|nr:hypothetical protein [Chloroflexota bacterium]